MHVNKEAKKILAALKKNPKIKLIVIQPRDLVAISKMLERRRS